jgi:hypothetical protein
MSAASSPNVDVTPRRGAITLQRFAAVTAIVDGLSLSSLSPIDQLEVRTDNSLYRITMLDGGGRVLVRGGAAFPVWSEASLAGSTLGGSCLKVGWIGRGFCLEFVREGRRVVTSPAREIRKIEPAPVAIG